MDLAAEGERDLVDLCVYEGGPTAIGDAGFDQLGDLVGAVCLMRVNAVAGCGRHDVEPGYLESWNVRGLLPYTELLDHPVFGVGGHHDGDRDVVTRRGPQCGDRVMH